MICTVCRKGILESWCVRVQEIMICTVCRKGILESWCVRVQEIMICTVCKEMYWKVGVYEVIHLNKFPEHFLHQCVARKFTIFTSVYIIVSHIQCCQNNFSNILSSQQSYPNFSVPKNPKKSKHSFYQKNE